MILRMAPNTLTDPITRARVFTIAWPIILSNLSTPLLGLVDTAVVGHLGDPALIGAIAVGGMIFSFLYWGFGFLRMGTTGLVSQAYGSGDAVEVRASFYRAYGIGAAIGITLLLAQGPIGMLAFTLIDGSTGVETAASTYFTIRILGAPLSLAHLAVVGFLLGRQHTTQLLFLQLLLNGTNILLDIVFVVVLDMGVAGVAAATVIAELVAIVFGTVMVVRTLQKDGNLAVSRARLFDMDALRQMFSVNRDIMIRTLCLIFAFAWFTNEGAQAGDTVLAANAILMQFVTFSAFFLDGFALAAETLVGNAVGSRDAVRLGQSIRFSTELGAATALLLTVLIAAAGPAVIALLTTAPGVIDMAATYLPWAIAAPLTSIWCYLLDGIFIGATRTSEMRNAMVISLVAYLAVWYALTPLGNHGLWAALMFYFLARAGSLYAYLPAVYRAAGRPLNPAC